jgi:hypothetical protein
MSLQGNHKNCFWSHNCPDCSKETCPYCTDYVPLTGKSIENMGDQLFEETYGYGGALRIGE